VYKLIKACSGFEKKNPELSEHGCSEKIIPKKILMIEKNMKNMNFLTYKKLAKPMLL